MTINFEDGRIDLIKKIEKKINEKIPDVDAALLKAFLEQYYLGVSSYDLRTKSILDLYGSLVSHWHFIYQRMPGESKLRVYNPQIEQHGWQSSHTVIEIDHDDKPFMLDSVRLALKKLDINIHLIIHAEGVRFIRDAEGKITKVLPLDSKERIQADAPIYIEIDKQNDGGELTAIAAKLEQVLSDVDVIVKDWPAMLASLNKVITTLSADNSEVADFLKWLADDHFTFLGYVEYKYKNNILACVKNTGLGVLAENSAKSLSRDLDKMYVGAREEYLSSEVLLLGKTDTISTVHRSAYTDFVAIKFFNAEGKLDKIFRFVGLYTSAAYVQAPQEIPYIRQKFARVFNMAHFSKNSHDGKALLHIIETLPRDEILQAKDTDLFEFSMGVLHLQERLMIRVFIRRDTFGRYFSCFVFVPKEIFTSQLRKKMQDILLDVLHGVSVSFDNRFSESALVRVDYMVRVASLQPIAFDVTEIENKLIEAARDWNDDLKDALSNSYGENKSNELYKIFGNAFPVSYKEMFHARAAVTDIEHMLSLARHDDSHLEMGIYKPIEDSDDIFRFKLFRNHQALPLSDIVPILENMGLKIISERPHSIKLSDGRVVWINDYCTTSPGGQKFNTESIKDIFQDAFDAVWRGNAENDGFNKLVIQAKLGWRDISILRAYYRYSWQLGLVFSQVSVQDALFQNMDLTKKLINYFYIKFDPQQQGKNENDILINLKNEIEHDLESVVSLNEDRIIRNYLVFLRATIRTNYFQTNARGLAKSYCSYKFDSSKIPDMPLPKSLYEVFVYAPYMEGIHLRADMVARGGIRWSDRFEDYRTEILGLMKTQQVKNAVIVPMGAKGGFIVKSDNKTTIECYQTLIRGLLDLTDNYSGVEIVKPVNTVCYDQDDPYLVVAADKGTATFSDIANSLSQEYNFWLGDAFASGGSTGYDHKKLAITARGAWESVKMHFQRLGIDIATQSITVMGIGDMAGDVFGNGMLLSNKIKLIAAFNHMHIFLDPDPDPEISFAERKRLFNLPNSKWSDYNKELISLGGAVFARTAKKIILTKQIQQVLDTTLESMEPNELIKAILTMKVDLFYNGGIGTFVKASTEKNMDVGDRANDAIRINGKQLNVSVVCEGGNLGFTQLARVEYAQKGGLINTDAIDNSGGVNCSDNEVNIKILLDSIVAAGDLTEKQRNDLLASMSNDVAKLVLANNISQNKALTMTDYQAASNLQMHFRQQKELERAAGLDPIVEYLPSTEEIAIRLSAERGFTRPETAVLMAYTKIDFKRQLLSSGAPDDKYYESMLVNYFPQTLHDLKYRSYMQQHRLKRAIIATQISNYVIDEMGINFLQRLQEESGSSSPEIASAYMVAREVFDADNLRQQISSLGCSVYMDICIHMMQDLNRLIRRVTRWFLRNSGSNLEISEYIKRYKPLVSDLNVHLDNYLIDVRLERTMAEREKLLAANVPLSLAQAASKFNALFAALDIVQAAVDNDLPLDKMARVFFLVGVRLKLGLYGEMLNKQPVKNYWEALARATFRDDVDKLQRNLAITIIKSGEEVDSWFTKRKQLFVRWDYFMAELKVSTPEFTMFAVALRELLELSRAVRKSEA